MMELLEDSGQLCIVCIEGVQWHMTTGEYLAMRRLPFHFWPHHLKRINPAPHSCARCINRPFDFQDTNRRTCTPVPPCPNWGWTKSAPYYENIFCEFGEWPEEKKIVRTEANK